jgi:hypothetical protein
MAGVLGKPEGQAEPAPRGGKAADYPEPNRVTFYFLEQGGGRLQLARPAYDCADLKVPIDFLPDVDQFAFPFKHCQKFPQVFKSLSPHFRPPRFWPAQSVFLKVT